MGVIGERGGGSWEGTISCSVPLASRRAREGLLLEGSPSPREGGTSGGGVSVSEGGRDFWWRDLRLRGRAGLLVEGSLSQREGGTSGGGISVSEGGRDFCWRDLRLRGRAGLLLEGSPSLTEGGRDFWWRDTHIIVLPECFTFAALCSFLLVPVRPGHVRSPGLSLQEHTRLPQRHRGDEEPHSVIGSDR
ncbi:unnamed protein product [Boreogadus saida]